MKRKISTRELKQIRAAVEALLDHHDGNDILAVSIILPYNCGASTLEFAQQLITALKKVNCHGTISSLLSFSGKIASDQHYEVLPYIPIASPCIRVYEQEYRLQRLASTKLSLKNWLILKVRFLLKLIRI